MRTKSLLLLILLVCLQMKAFAQQDPLLQSGPMVGYSAMREVMLWVQTKSAASVHFEYWVKGNPKSRFKTETTITQKNNAFTAHLSAAILEPGTIYEYELFINGKVVKRNYPLQFQTQALWQWRADAPAFSFATGSCNYINDSTYDRPGRPYGGDFNIFRSIADKKPDFMLWLGDNVYLREADWDSRAGIHYRYSHTRAVPSLQPLLGSVHHYAIWDDHDFGPNDADRSYAFKDVTLETFKLFWANPNYGVADEQRRGLTGTFTWGDVQFFLLDDRYFRSPNNISDTEREMFGEQQLNWLVEALSSSKAKFKIIAAGGQLMNPAVVFENFSTYQQERTKLIERLRRNKIEGVVFMSGDRHHTELTRYQENNDVYPFYDITISPLTSGVANPQEYNPFRVENTLVKAQNFAIIGFSGPNNNRVMKITVYDKDGKQLWEHNIAASDLTYKK